MRNIVIELLSALLVFMMLKIIIVIACKGTRKVLKIPEDKEMTYSFYLSVVIQVAFIMTWFQSIVAGSNLLELTNLEAYISLCLIGVFSVLWCYFSWDIEHIFVFPRKAKPKERRAKKLLVYLLIYIFVVCQGYYQVLHAIDKNYEVNALLSVSYYSIVVGIIALDRIMNQLIKD